MTITEVIKCEIKILIGIASLLPELWFKIFIKKNLAKFQWKFWLCVVYGNCKILAKLNKCWNENTGNCRYLHHCQRWSADDIKNKFMID